MVHATAFKIKTFQVIDHPPSPLLREYNSSLATTWAQFITLPLSIVLIMLEPRSIDESSTLIKTVVLMLNSDSSVA